MPGEADVQQIYHYAESALIGEWDSSPALSLALLYRPNCNYLVRAAFNLVRELSLVKAMRPRADLARPKKKGLRFPVDARSHALFSRTERESQQAVLRELNLKSRPCQLCDELGK
jgi:hypothetical protein